MEESADEPITFKIEYDESSCVNSDNTKKDVNVWTREQTFLLIDLFKKYKPLLQKHTTISVFSLISKKICEETGDLKPPNICQKKYHNLIRSYKKCLSRDAAKKTTQKFPFFNAIHELSLSNIEYSIEAGVEEEIKNLSGNTLVKKQDIPSEDSDSLLLLNPVPEKDQWTEQETFSLIEVYKKTKDSIGKVKLYWEIVANELSQIGISKDPKKCMKKLFNLRRTYNKFLEKGKMSSNRFPFMENLREVFGNTVIFKQDEDGEEIIFGEIVDSTFIDEVLWSDDEIRLLLICYAQVKASSYQSKSDVFWELLSAQMGESGVGRSAYECEQKIKGLISSYERSKIEGNFHQFPYYEEIEQLFGVEDEEEEVEYLETDFLIPNQSSEPQNSEESKMEEKIVKLEEQPIELDESSEDPPNIEDPPKASIWKPSQTVHLLNCMKNYEKMEDEEEKWNLVARQLKKDQTDVENKWESLVKLGKLVFKERIDKAQFPYYKFMLELFGEDLFMDKGGNAPGSLSEDQVMELIELKHFYSKSYKAMKLPFEAWEKIVLDMKLELDPKILEKNYYEMFTKYMFLKEQNSENPEKEWKLFGVFDDTLNKEEPEESEMERNLRLVSEKFNEICKICLNVEETDLSSLESGSEMAEKIKTILFDDQDEMELEITNLICQKCRNNVEKLFEFRKQHKESLDILKEFKKNYLICREENVEKRGVKRKIESVDV